MRVAGWASTPASDHLGRSIAANAFGTLPADVRLLLEHDADRCAGTINVLQVREGNLWCEATLDVSLPGMARVASEIRRGKRYGYSVGANRLKGFHVVSSAELYEISITDSPRNPACSLSWIDRPQNKLWPDDLAELYAEQDLAVAKHKSKQEGLIKWLSSQISDQH